MPDNDPSQMPQYYTPWCDEMRRLLLPSHSAVWATMRKQSADWIYWAGDIADKSGYCESTVSTAFNALCFHGYMGGAEIRRGGRGTICRYFVISAIPLTREEYLASAINFVDDDYEQIISKMGPKIRKTLADNKIRYPDGKFYLIKLPVARDPKKEKKKRKVKPSKSEAIISPVPEMPHEPETTVAAVETESSAVTPPVVESPPPDTDKVDVCVDYAKDITLSPPAKESYVHMKKQTRVDVVDVFNVWNSFKAPKDVVKSEGQIKWRRHNKMTHDMLTVLCETLKTHMIDEMCVAIENYSTTLFSKETYWSHTYDLSSFFNVRHKKDFKGGEKKWLSFSEERWDLMSFISRQEHNTRQERENRRLEAAREEKALPYRAERDREVTKALIVAYKTSIKSRNYVPSKAGLTHFIGAANNLIEFFEEDGTKTSTPIMIGTLMGVVQKEYLDRGQEFKLWMLTNRHMWTALMPAKRAAK